jgi:hypothetical protein
MPVDFQSIQIQIRAMGQQAGSRERDLKEKLELALAALRQNAVELDRLQARVDQVAAASNNLRCALPAGEVLTIQAATPALNCAYVLYAADGSQVIPSHHDAVEFGVINVGAVRMLPGQAYPPREIVSSTLLAYDSLYNSQGSLMTEDVLALMRDVEERKALAALARAETLPVVTLTDGQLELFGEAKSSREFEKKLDDYIKVLESLASLGVVTAGYVDKPGSDLVTRLLDLMLLDESEVPQAENKRRLRGLRDKVLFDQILGPGQRSAIFGIHSRHTRFEGALAVHFFYLNVARTGRPHVARVEIPAWVADDPALVDLLHFALVSQSRQMGSRPYPYILHRAHEVAVISQEEKKQLESMILIELRRLGIDVSDISDKQFAKDLQPRMRYP